MTMCFLSQEDHLNAVQGIHPERLGSCGREGFVTRVRVADESGEPVPSCEVGEICVRPARSGDFAGVYTPMLGYWNKPEATREVLRGDRYHTGDLGVLAADGNLYIRGRRNDLILRGGANVYPAEVERVLQSHPAVAAAAVLGVPDQRLGERVVAAVQLLPAAEADEERLIDHTRAQLARYKVPEALCFVDEMPRNAMNKIVKSRLRDLFERDRSPA